MKKYLFLSTITIYFSLVNSSYAYLDPGTGSIILQAILAFIAASLATLSFYWNKVKTFLSRLFKKNKKSEHN